MAFTPVSPSPPLPGQAPRRASGAPVPFLDPLVTFVLVRTEVDRYGQGSVAAIRYAASPEAKRAMLLGLRSTDMLYVAWPGKFYQDLLWVDDLSQAFRGLGLTRTPPPPAPAGTDSFGNTWHEDANLMEAADATAQAEVARRRGDNRTRHAAQVRAREASDRAAATERSASRFATGGVVHPQASTYADRNAFRRANGYS